MAIYFTDAAIDDLRRIDAAAVPRVLRKILLLQDDVEAGAPLGGSLTGFRKLVVGRNTWRVVYRIAEDATVEICEIWAVGQRRDAEVYAEAVQRVQDAVKIKPELVALVDVVERLGRLARGVEVTSAAIRRDLVPDWLAERLIHTVGLPRERVAALDLKDAVDLWTAYISGDQLKEP